MSSAKILIADDEEAMRSVVGNLLRTEGYEVLEAADGEQALATTLSDAPQLVLLDMHMPKIDGLQLLQQAREHGSPSDFIMVTGFGSVELAVEVMRAGALDIVRKPFAPKDLLAAVGSCLRAMPSTPSQVRLVGASTSLKLVTDTIRRAAPTRATILVLGESGTGKELIAQLTHESSDRADKPFVKVNCAALPPNLLESELFGHERGAFTGASARREGRFELAHGGTLFLDEVGELTPDIQVKLLRVLQSREFERVGSSRTLRTDVRVIAATNRPLESMVRAGTFREDLYYRLNVVAVTVPPLRTRKEDIPALAEHFFKLYATEYKKQVKGISRPAMDALMMHAWPGNVRELQNAIERAVVLAEGRELTPDLFPNLGQLELAPIAAGAATPLAGRRFADIEREAIMSTLAMVGGSPSRAAEALGISVRKIYYRLREYRASTGMSDASLNAGGELQQNELRRFGPVDT